MSRKSRRAAKELAAVEAGREWVEIKGNDQRTKGVIPRTVIEAMGIDLSPVDNGFAVWFDREQSAAIHSHPLWEEI